MASPSFPHTPESIHDMDFHHQPEEDRNDQCVDTESNPGPDTRNNWERAGDYLRADTKTRDLRQRSSTDTDRTPHDTASYTLGDTVLKMQSFQAQMVECMNRCLQQVDENQTVLSDNIHLLNKWFRSLQSQNDQLREDIEYLLTKCKALERPCRQFFAGQSDMFQTTRDLVDQTDKLHSPCTNRPHTSPRDGLASAQPHPSTAPPHQLDSSTPAESLGDLERQPTLGHPKKTTEANSMACTGAGEAGKEEQIQTPSLKLKPHISLNPGSRQQSSDPGKIVVLDSCPEFGKKKKGGEKLSESEFKKRDEKAEAKMKVLLTDHGIDQVICTDGSVKHGKQFAGYGHLAWNVKKREFHSKTQNTVEYCKGITSTYVEIQAVKSAKEFMINYTKENPAATTYLVLSDSKDMINNLKNESNELRKELESLLQETHIKKIIFVYCSEDANFRLSVYADRLARHVPLPKGLDIPSPDSEL